MLIWWLSDSGSYSCLILEDRNTERTDLCLGFLKAEWENYRLLGRLLGLHLLHSLSVVIFYDFMSKITDTCCLMVLCRLPKSTVVILLVLSLGEVTHHTSWISLSAITLASQLLHMFALVTLQHAFLLNVANWFFSKFFQHFHQPPFSQLSKTQSHDISCILLLF